MTNMRIPSAKSLHGLGPLVVLFVVITLVYIVRIIFGNEITSRNLEVAQVVALPLICLPFVITRLVNIPRVVFFLPIILGISAVVFNYSFQVDSSSAKLIVARFIDDNDESVSRRFRERIKSNVDRFGADLDLARHPLSIKKERDARALFKSDALLGAVAWGDRKAIRITLREELPKKLSSITDRFNKDRLADVVIIESISRFSLPFFPEEGTAFFLTNFFDGFVERPDTSELDISRRMFHLDAALGYAGHGKIKVHRAVAVWKLATMELIKIIKENSLSQEALNCISSRYETAMKMFYTHDNPELLLSIMNNRAVTMLLLGEATGDIFYKAEARRILGESRQFLRGGKKVLGRTRAADAIRGNVAVLDGQIQQKKKKRSKVKKVK